MKSPSNLLAATLAGALAFAAGCGGAAPRPLALPPPVELTTLGTGDVFELHVVGEDKLPTSFTVAPDGTVDLPYVARVRVAGLEPQEVADVLRARLIEEQILRRPSVSVSVKEYNSKRVEVLGEVQKPGSLPLQPGMTLLRALSLSGGLNSLADRDRVTIRRRSPRGTLAAVVSVKDIVENRVPDPMLQAGDSIHVDQLFM